MKPFFTEHIIKNFCEDTEVWTYEKKAEYLNRVLEERCVRVSGRRFFDGVWEIEEMVCGKSKPIDTHTALMLPPEPIENPVCKHETDKVVMDMIFDLRTKIPTQALARCECGKNVRLRNDAFEEV